MITSLPSLKPQIAGYPNPFHSIGVEKIVYNSNLKSMKTRTTLDVIKITIGKTTTEVSHE